MKVLMPTPSRLVERGANTPTLMRCHWDIIEACVPPVRVIATLEYAGFTDVHRHVAAGIFSEYQGRKSR